MAAGFTTSRVKWLLLPLALLPAAGALDAPFLYGYDDNFFTRDNPLFQPGGSARLLKEEWEFLSYAVFAVDRLLVGKFAGGYRLLTALLHGLSALLVFRIARTLLRGRAAEDPRGAEGEWPALLAAVLFVVHPTTVETVAWVNQQRGALAQTLGLWAVSVYLGGSGCAAAQPGSTAGDGPALPRFAAAWSLLWLAQFAKISAIGLWFAFAALESLLFGGPRWKRVLRALAMAVPCVVGALMVLSMRSGHLVPPLGGDAWDGRIAATLHLHGRAWGLLLAPVGLSPFYHVSPLIPLLDWAVLAALAIPIAWLALYRLLGLDWKRAAILLLWMVGALAPSMNPLSSISFVLQDRYVYAALAPVAILFAGALQGAAARIPARTARVPPLALVGILLATLLGALSFSQSFLWRSEAALLAAAVQRQPASGLAHLHYARHLFHSAAGADPVQRREIFKECLRQHLAAAACDDSERSSFGLFHLVEHAQVRNDLGDIEGARALFRRVWDGREEGSLERGAKFAALRYLVYDALMTAHYAEALALAQQGLARQPDHPEMLFRRLQALENLGRKDEALAEAQRLLANPQVAPAAKAVIGRLQGTERPAPQRKE